MTLQQLRYFLATADHGSFAGAADELLLKQPSIAEQMRRLEAELGVALFTRARRRLTLTPAGEALRPYAEQALSTCREGADAVRAHRTLRGGRHPSACPATPTSTSSPTWRWRCTRAIRWSGCG